MSYLVSSKERYTDRRTDKINKKMILGGDNIKLKYNDLFNLICQVRLDIAINHHLNNLITLPTAMAIIGNGDNVRRFIIEAVLIASTSTQIMTS